MSLIRALVGLGTALLSGCNAPAACETQVNGGVTPNTSAEPLIITTTLTQSGETFSKRARARLGNLPELWQDDTNILGGSLSLSLVAVYQAAPQGDDGKTQMPRVSAELGLGETQSSLDISTNEFQAGNVSGNLDGFRTCHTDDEQDCCKYGARECSFPLRLSVRRLDGAPFPPVDVTVTLGADAEVTRCPVDDQKRAVLALEAESP